MKILIVAEELTSVVWTFAMSLHEQRQEIILLTSRNEVVDQVPPFQIMTPFQTWSLREGFKLVPRVLSWNPDIIHFLFTHRRHHPRPAQWVLSSVFASLPQKTLAASFFVDGSLRTITDRAFLRLFDLNTFGTRTQLMRMKRKKVLPKSAIADVLPPIEGNQFVRPSQIRPELEQLIQSLGRFVLLPDPPPSHLDIRLLNQKGLEVLVLSDRFRKKTDFFSTGPLSGSERDFVFSRAAGLIAAECDLSVLELQRYREICERHQIPIVVTPYQNELLPGLCWHGKSGWILDKGLGGLELLLAQHPHLLLAKGYHSLTGQELVDTTLNELVRLYRRAYEARWT